MSRAKSPETRQRRNVSKTAATLPADGKVKPPNLPAGIRQKETRTWWKVLGFADGGGMAGSGQAIPAKAGRAG